MPAGHQVKKAHYGRFNTKASDVAQSTIDHMYNKNVHFRESGRVSLGRSGGHGCIYLSQCGQGQLDFPPVLGVFGDGIALQVDCFQGGNG